MQTEIIYLYVKLLNPKMIKLKPLEENKIVKKIKKNDSNFSFFGLPMIFFMN